jgi:hypothetical protein
MWRHNPHMLIHADAGKASKCSNYRRSLWVGQHVAHMLRLYCVLTLCWGVVTTELLGEICQKKRGWCTDRKFTK